MLPGNHKLARSKMIALVSALLIASCSASPEAQMKENEQAMETLITSAVQHMLDRNPATIQESMNYLSRSEMAPNTFEKLQNQHLLPETDLSILKIMQEAKAKHTSNEVVVSTVRPMDPLSKPTVRFKVIGKQIMKQDGKPIGDQVFQFTVTCRLTDPQTGNPQITDLVSDTPTVTAQADTKVPPRKKHRH